MAVVARVNLKQLRNIVLSNIESKDLRSSKNIGVSSKEDLNKVLKPLLAWIDGLIKTETVSVTRGHFIDEISKHSIAQGQSKAIFTAIKGMLLNGIDCKINDSELKYGSKTKLIKFKDSEPEAFKEQVLASLKLCNLAQEQVDTLENIYVKTFYGHSFKFTPKEQKPFYLTGNSLLNAFNYRKNARGLDLFLTRELGANIKIRKAPMTKKDFRQKELVLSMVKPKLKEFLVDPKKELSFFNLHRGNFQKQLFESLGNSIFVKGDYGMKSFSGQAFIAALSWGRNALALFDTLRDLGLEVQGLPLATINTMKDKQAVKAAIEMKIKVLRFDESDHLSERNFDFDKFLDTNFYLLGKVKSSKIRSRGFYRAVPSAEFTGRDFCKANGIELNRVAVINHLQGLGIIQKGPMNFELAQQENVQLVPNRIVKFG